MTFIAALQAAGLHPRDVVPDGRIRRCKTDGHPHRRNGWYVLSPDGRGYWGNWALNGHAPMGEWKDAYADHLALSPAVQARMREQRERERLERLGAIKNAQMLWAKSKPYRPHPYLADKGLSTDGCSNLRTWQGRVFVDGAMVDDTWLMVPIYRHGRLVNIQRISSSGIKRQMKSAPQRGCWLVIDRPRAAMTCIVEGLRTGLAVYQSCRLARVVVAFFADNLAPVVSELRPTGTVVIAADNDYGTALRGKGNPGIEKARNAAELIGCGVAWPDDILGTDFADMLNEVGERGPRRIERLLQAAATYVTAMPP